MTWHVLRGSQSRSSSDAHVEGGDARTSLGPLAIPCNDRRLYDPVLKGACRTARMGGGRPPGSLSGGSGGPLCRQQDGWMPAIKGRRTGYGQRAASSDGSTDPGTGVTPPPCERNWDLLLPRSSVLRVIPTTVSVLDPGQPVPVRRPGRKAAEPTGLRCARLHHAASMKARFLHAPVAACAGVLDRPQ